MPLDEPACFRLDRIPVRPIGWLSAGPPVFLAVVRTGLATRRRWRPMRARPTDPTGAPRRPYGLGRRGTNRGETQGMASGRRPDIVRRIKGHNG